MRTIVAVLFSLFSLPLFAETVINKPLITLVNENGDIVATDSTSIEKAMEKASALPDGVYILKRPDVTITVKPNVTNSNVLTVNAKLKIDPDGKIRKYEWLKTGKQEIVKLDDFKGDCTTFTFPFKTGRWTSFEIIATEVTW